MTQKNLWKDNIDSPIFGYCEGLDNEELKQIVDLIDKNPVAAFGLLNRKLNDRGLCFGIEEKP